MQKLRYLLIAGGGFWILSELMEQILVQNASATLLLTALFHFLIAVGIWGTYLGDAKTKRTKIGLIGTVMISIGYFMFVFPQLSILMDPSITFSEFLDANPIYLGAAVFSIIGMMIFGASILVHKTYALWTGIVLMTCPIIAGAIIMLMETGSIAPVFNILTASAIIAIGIQAKHAQDDSA